MKNSKKLFLIFLSVLIVAFVSCKKDSGGSITTPTPTFKLSSLVGTWKPTVDNNNALSIKDADGTITTTINSTVITFTTENWDTKKNEEVQKYTLTTNKTEVPSYNASLTFKSASSCDLSVTFKENNQVFNETFKKEPTAAIK